MSTQVLKRFNPLFDNEGATSPEKIWRPLIPVDSFTKQPVDPVIEPPDPVVGIRWGKPADFTFDAAFDDKQTSHQFEVREVPRRYFENSIIDFTEAYRFFTTGQVDVQLEEPDPIADWAAYLEAIKAKSIPATSPKVELEETDHWIFDSGYSYSKYDSEGNVTNNINVHYQFNMERYIPFKQHPQPKVDERGEKPE